jgi:primosomal protein N' (replication factor Y) (superfamily II helicase)
VVSRFTMSQLRLFDDPEPEPPPPPTPYTGKVAAVVVDLALDREFDYAIPDGMVASLRIGDQVEVPFGRGNRPGFVVALKDHSEYARLKPIRRVLQQELIVPSILKLARWMAEYYACAFEQALQAVLPGAVRRGNTKDKEQLYAIATDEAARESTRAALRKKAPKQAAALDLLLTGDAIPAAELARSAGVTHATLKNLEQKGLLTLTKQAVRRDPLADAEYVQTLPLTLSAEQQRAVELAQRCVDTRDPAVLLLFGVTGSGKTEVYMQAIQHTLTLGKTAIMLVPEIALTPQTVERFRGRFGKRIAVLHSHLSDGERHDEWRRIQKGGADIVVGARSALFAPVRNLGLIVVDEEHEPSYKQQESPPYNARDVAVMRGHMEGCGVLLGTATPSVETFHNVHRGKYACARLDSRVDDRRLPVVRVVDMRRELHEGKPSLLSRDLIDAVHLRLTRSEQVILFLNRRGYATSMVCPSCGHVMKCAQCSISMTYHRKRNELRCHLCDEIAPVPARCPNPECRDAAIRFSGAGTERIETIVQKCFPKAVVQRVDSDTMTRKDAYRRVLGDFRTGKIDILIGTQMIAKGLHFPNVTLVGIINADGMLHMPDFRASERTFQLMTQVSGRAGRGDVAGEVVVQTSCPTHPAIQCARELDYERFFDEEIEARRAGGYPPFTHLVNITLRSPQADVLETAARDFAKALFERLPNTIDRAGPMPSPITQIKGHYRMQIVLRSPSTRSMTHALRDILAHYSWPKEVRHFVDVDALSLM